MEVAALPSPRFSRVSAGEGDPSFQESGAAAYPAEGALKTQELIEELTALAGVGCVL